MVSQASAKGSPLGYFYQTRYALFLLVSASRYEAQIMLEGLDDIEFDADGNAKELLQVKHHVNSPAKLTNLSTDLWKTIGMWCQHLREGRLSSHTILTLVTTSTASDSETSVARHLRPKLGRDSKFIASEFLKISQNSDNKQLQSYFRLYQSLTDSQRETLIDAIQLIDGATGLENISEQIKVKLLIPPKYQDAIYERVEGWWNEKVIQQLKSKSPSPISKEELINKVENIRDQFRPDALPIDFFDEMPPDRPDPEGDNRQFVQQLRAIALTNSQIETAILDYFRAFAQRSKWQREQLLDFEELERYEKRLIDKWNRFREWPKLSNYDPSDENEMIQIGRNIYQKIEQEEIPIRDRVQATYVQQGSFHILAHERPPRVWWHPQFIERLKLVLEIPTPLPIWVRRPVEIANLFNPAFCARLLRSAVKEYQGERQQGMPYPLMFLILPIVLYKPIRDILPRDKRTKLHKWIQENPSAHVGFAKRTSDLLHVTKDSISFGMTKGIIDWDKNDEFISTDQRYRMKKQSNLPFTMSETEVKDIERRSELIGRLFAQNRSVSSNYLMWGIRP